MSALELGLGKRLGLAQVAGYGRGPEEMLSGIECTGTGTS